MSDLPDVLRLTEMGEGRYDVTQPAESAEGRDVVFSGQYLAQMLMAAEASGPEHMRYNNLARELVQGLLKRARPTYAPQVRALAERIGLLA